MTKSDESDNMDDSGVFPESESMSDQAREVGMAKLSSGRSIALTLAFSLLLIPLALNRYEWPRDVVNNTVSPSAMRCNST